MQPFGKGFNSSLREDDYSLERIKINVDTAGGWGAFPPHHAVGGGGSFPPDHGLRGGCFPSCHPFVEGEECDDEDVKLLYSPIGYVVFKISLLLAEEEALGVCWSPEDDRLRLASDTSLEASSFARLLSPYQAPGCSRLDILSRLAEPPTHSDERCGKQEKRAGGDSATTFKSSRVMFNRLEDEGLQGSLDFHLTQRGFRPTHLPSSEQRFDADGIPRSYSGFFSPMVDNERFLENQSCGKTSGPCVEDEENCILPAQKGGREASSYRFEDGILQAYNRSSRLSHTGNDYSFNLRDTRAAFSSDKEEKLSRYRSEDLSYIHPGALGITSTVETPKEEGFLGRSSIAKLENIHWNLGASMSSREMLEESSTLSPNRCGSYGEAHSSSVKLSQRLPPHISMKQNLLPLSYPGLSSGLNYPSSRRLASSSKEFESLGDVEIDFVEKDSRACRGYGLPYNISAPSLLLLENERFSSHYTMKREEKMHPLLNGFACGGKSCSLRGSHVEGLARQQKSSASSCGDMRLYDQGKQLDYKRNLLSFPLEEEEEEKDSIKGFASKSHTISETGGMKHLTASSGESFSSHPPPPPDNQCFLARESHIFESACAWPSTRQQVACVRSNHELPVAIRPCDNEAFSSGSSRSFHCLRPQMRSSKGMCAVGGIHPTLKHSDRSVRKLPSSFCDDSASVSAAFARFSIESSKMRRIASSQRMNPSASSSSCGGIIHEPLAERGSPHVALSSTEKSLRRVSFHSKGRYSNRRMIYSSAGVHHRGVGSSSAVSSCTKMSSSTRAAPHRDTPTSTERNAMLSNTVCAAPVDCLSLLPFDEALKSATDPCSSHPPLRSSARQTHSSPLQSRTPPCVQRASRQRPSTSLTLDLTEACRALPPSGHKSLSRSTEVQPSSLYGVRAERDSQLVLEASLQHATSAFSSSHSSVVGTVVDIDEGEGGGASGSPPPHAETARHVRGIFGGTRGFQGLCERLNPFPSITSSTGYDRGGCGGIGKNAIQRAAEKGISSRGESKRSEAAKKLRGVGKTFLRDFISNPCFPPFIASIFSASSSGGEKTHSSMSRASGRCKASVTNHNCKIHPMTENRSIKERSSYCTLGRSYPSLKYEHHHCGSVCSETGSVGISVAAQPSSKRKTYPHQSNREFLERNHPEESHREGFVVCDWSRCCISAVEGLNQSMYANRREHGGRSGCGSHLERAGEDRAGLCVPDNPDAPCSSTFSLLTSYETCALEGIDEFESNDVFDNLHLQALQKGMCSSPMQCLWVNRGSVCDGCGLLYLPASSSRSSDVSVNALSRKKELYSNVKHTPLFLIARSIHRLLLTAVRNLLKTAGLHPETIRAIVFSTLALFMRIHSQCLRRFFFLKRVSLSGEVSSNDVLLPGEIEASWFSSWESHHHGVRKMSDEDFCADGSTVCFPPSEISQEDSATSVVCASMEAPSKDTLSSLFHLPASSTHRLGRLQKLDGKDLISSCLDPTGSLTRVMSDTHSFQTSLPPSEGASSSTHHLNHDSARLTTTHHLDTLRPHNTTLREKPPSSDSGSGFASASTICEGGSTVDRLIALTTSLEARECSIHRHQQATSNMRTYTHTPTRIHKLSTAQTPRSSSALISIAPPPSSLNPPSLTSPSLTSPSLNPHRREFRLPNKDKPRELAAPFCGVDSSVTPSTTCTSIISGGEGDTPCFSFVAMPGVSRSSLAPASERFTGFPKGVAVSNPSVGDMDSVPPVSQSLSLSSSSPPRGGVVRAVEEKLEADVPSQTYGCSMASSVAGDNLGMRKNQEDDGRFLGNLPRVSMMRRKQEGRLDTGREFDDRNLPVDAALTVSLVASEDDHCVRKADTAAMPWSSSCVVGASEEFEALPRIDTFPHLQTSSHFQSPPQLQTFAFPLGKQHIVHTSSLIKSLSPLFSNLSSSRLGDTSPECSSCSMEMLPTSRASPETSKRGVFKVKSDEQRSFGSVSRHERVYMPSDGLVNKSRVSSEDLSMSVCEFDEASTAEWPSHQNSYVVSSESLSSFKSPSESTSWTLASHPVVSSHEGTCSITPKEVESALFVAYSHLSHASSCSTTACMPSSCSGASSSFTVSCLTESPSPSIALHKSIASSSSYLSSSSSCASSSSSFCSSSSSCTSSHPLPSPPPSSPHPLASAASLSASSSLHNISPLPNMSNAFSSPANLYPPPVGASTLLLPTLSGKTESKPLSESSHVVHPPSPPATHCKIAPRYLIDRPTNRGEDTVECLPRSISHSRRISLSAFGDFDSIHTRGGVGHADSAVKPQSLQRCLMGSGGSRGGCLEHEALSDSRRYFSALHSKYRPPPVTCSAECSHTYSYVSGISHATVGMHCENKVFPMSSSFSGHTRLSDAHLHNTQLSHEYLQNTHLPHTHQPFPHLAHTHHPPPYYSQFPPAQSSLEAPNFLQCEDQFFQGLKHFKQLLLNHRYRIGVCTSPSCVPKSSSASSGEQQEGSSFCGLPPPCLEMHSPALDAQITHIANETLLLIEKKRENCSILRYLHPSLQLQASLYLAIAWMEDKPGDLGWLTKHRIFKAPHTPSESDYHREMAATRGLHVGLSSSGIPPHLLKMKLHLRSPLKANLMRNSDIMWYLELLSYKLMHPCSLMSQYDQESECMLEGGKTGFLEKEYDDHWSFWWKEEDEGAHSGCVCESSAGAAYEEVSASRWNGDNSCVYGSTVSSLHVVGCGRSSSSYKCGSVASSSSSHSTNPPLSSSSSSPSHSTNPPLSSSSSHPFHPPHSSSSHPPHPSLSPFIAPSSCFAPLFPSSFDTLEAKQLPEDSTLGNAGLPSFLGGFWYESPACHKALATPLSASTREECGSYLLSCSSKMIPPSDHPSDYLVSGASTPEREKECPQGGLYCVWSSSRFFPNEGAEGGAYCSPLTLQEDVSSELASVAEEIGGHRRESASNISDFTRGPVSSEENEMCVWGTCGSIQTSYNTPGNEGRYFEDDWDDRYTHTSARKAGKGQFSDVKCDDGSLKTSLHAQHECRGCEEDETIAETKDLVYEDDAESRRLEGIQSPPLGIPPLYHSEAAIERLVEPQAPNLNAFPPVMRWRLVKLIRNILSHVDQMMSFSSSSSFSSSCSASSASSPTSAVFSSSSSPLPFTTSSPPYSPPLSIPPTPLPNLPPSTPPSSPSSLPNRVALWKSVLLHLLPEWVVTHPLARRMFDVLSRSSLSSEVATSSPTASSSDDFKEIEGDPHSILLTLLSHLLPPMLKLSPLVRGYTHTAAASLDGDSSSENQCDPHHTQVGGGGIQNLSVFTDFLSLLASSSSYIIEHSSRLLPEMVHFLLAKKMAFQSFAASKGGGFVGVFRMGILRFSYTPPLSRGGFFFESSVAAVASFDDCFLQKLSDFFLQEGGVAAEFLVTLRDAILSACSPCLLECYKEGLAFLYQQAVTRLDPLGEQNYSDFLHPLRLQLSQLHLQANPLDHLHVSALLHPLLQPIFKPLLQRILPVLELEMMCLLQRLLQLLYPHLQRLHRKAVECAFNPHFLHFLREKLSEKSSPIFFGVGVLGAIFLALLLEAVFEQVSTHWRLKSYVRPSYTRLHAILASENADFLGSSGASNSVAEASIRFYSMGRHLQSKYESEVLMESSGVCDTSISLALQEKMMEFLSPVYDKSAGLGGCVMGLMHGFLRSFEDGRDRQKECLRSGCFSDASTPPPLPLYSCVGSVSAYGGGVCMDGRETLCAVSQARDATIEALHLGCGVASSIYKPQLLEVYKEKLDEGSWYALPVYIHPTPPMASSSRGGPLEVSADDLKPLSRNAPTRESKPPTPPPSTLLTPFWHTAKEDSLDSSYAEFLSQTHRPHFDENTLEGALARLQEDLPPVTLGRANADVSLITPSLVEGSKGGGHSANLKEGFYRRLCLPSIVLANQSIEASISEVGGTSDHTPSSFALSFISSSKLPSGREILSTTTWNLPPNTPTNLPSTSLTPPITTSSTPPIPPFQPLCISPSPTPPAASLSSIPPSERLVELCDNEKPSFQVVHTRESKNLEDSHVRTSSCVLGGYEQVHEHESEFGVLENRDQKMHSLSSFTPPSNSALAMGWLSFEDELEGDLELASSEGGPEDERVVSRKKGRCSSYDNDGDVCVVSTEVSEWWERSWLEVPTFHTYTSGGFRDRMNLQDDRWSPLPPEDDEYEGFDLLTMI